MREYPTIIAVDFDGTLCENAYPSIGKPNISLINSLIERQNSGCELILWTTREGKELAEAVAWCKGYGLLFNSVNRNVPRIIQAFGGDKRKIFANEYIDDHNAFVPDLPYKDRTNQTETQSKNIDASSTLEKRDAEKGGEKCGISPERAVEILLEQVIEPWIADNEVIEAMRMGAEAIEAWNRRVDNETYL